MKMKCKNCGHEVELRNITHTRHGEICFHVAHSSTYDYISTVCPIRSCSCTRPEIDSKESDSE